MSSSIPSARSAGVLAKLLSFKSNSKASKEEKNSTIYDRFWKQSGFMVVTDEVGNVLIKNQQALAWKPARQ